MLPLIHYDDHNWSKACISQVSAAQFLTYSSILAGDASGTSKGYRSEWSKWTKKKKKRYEIASFSKLFLNFVQTLWHPFEGNCSFQFSKYIYLYRKNCNLVIFFFFCSTCSTRSCSNLVIRSTGCYSHFA